MDTLSTSGSAGEGDTGDHLNLVLQPLNLLNTATLPTQTPRLAPWPQRLAPLKFVGPDEPDNPNKPTTQ